MIINQIYNELPGGNSKSFDWNLLKGQQIKLPWFISGGINETNIKKIQNLLNPNGIDLSSGVEVSKGIKSNSKINNLFKNFMTIKNSLKQLPNEKGYFGSFGGRYVSETLMPLILEVEKEYEKIKNDNNFKKELDHYMKTYVGRPSPLFFAERITEDLGGAKIYFKRDELNHTGST